MKNFDIVRKYSRLVLINFLVFLFLLSILFILLEVFFYFYAPNHIGTIELFDECRYASEREMCSHSYYVEGRENIVLLGGSSAYGFPLNKSDVFSSLLNSYKYLQQHKKERY